MNDVSGCVLTRYWKAIRTRVAVAPVTDLRGLGRFVILDPLKTKRQSRVDRNNAPLTDSGRR